jgi:hypothetical protein
MKSVLAEKALHDATNQLQIMIFTREQTPIRDRQEAIDDLKLRVENLSKLGPDAKKRWRAGLLEMAAFALYAAISDE